MGKSISLDLIESNNPVITGVYSLSFWLVIVFSILLKNGTFSFINDNNPGNSSSIYAVEYLYKLETLSFCKRQTTISSILPGST